jgi:hypothetical protein
MTVMLDEGDSVHQAPQNAEGHVGLVRVKGLLPIRARCPYTIPKDDDTDRWRADLDPHHNPLTRAHKEPASESSARLAHRHLQICCGTGRETGNVGYAQGCLPGYPLEVASPRKLHLDRIPGVSSRWTSPLSGGITTTRTPSAGIFFLTARVETAGTQKANRQDYDRGSAPTR